MKQFIYLLFTMAFFSITFINCEGDMLVIEEPETGTEIASVTRYSTPLSCYYVTTKGDDTNSGSSEEKAWRTIKYAASIAKAGDTVYIKAGEYLDEHVVIVNSGTETEPIVFEGYRNRPGDKPQLKYDPFKNNKLDATIMPLLNGNDTTGRAFSITGKKFIEIKNIQITLYERGINCTQRDPSCDYITLDNIIGTDFGFTSPNNSIKATRYSGLGIQIYGNNCKILNCIIVDAGGENFGIRGDYHLVDKCESYSLTNHNPPDYFLHIGGDYNTIKNCKASNIGNNAPYGHGIGFKGDCKYNKVIDCVAENLQEDFLVRHPECQYNEFINCTGIKHNAFVIRDNASNNTFRNCKSKDAWASVLFWDSAEPSGQDGGGFNNTIVNCIFETSSTDPCIVFSNDTYPSNAQGNIFRNCVFSKGSKLFSGGSDLDKGNIMKNCIVTDVKALGENPLDFGIDITYSNFWKNGFKTPSGSGNMSKNPFFGGTSDFHLKSKYGRWNGTTWVKDHVTSPCIDAGDPADEYSKEPSPNGKKINIGAYGNTSEASKSTVKKKIVKY